MSILVTGAAGFIGYHVSSALLARGERVVGVDNINPYYDVKLKHARLQQLGPHPNFSFLEMDIGDQDKLASVIATNQCTRVVHLAAQAGVRHSLEKPFDYVDSNIVGMLSVLEGCRHSNVEHLVFASSSSVYGGRQQGPFRVTDAVDRPVSLYAATKVAGELMGHTYSHLYGIPMSGLRFFTVYGPWGRPDMAYFKFTEAIENGHSIDIYNEGKMERDFTFIDDVVEGVIRVLDTPPTARPAFQIHNIGRGEPVNLLRFIEILEQALGKEAHKILRPMQPGDVPVTWADVTSLKSEVGYTPTVSLADGIARFVHWYRSTWRGQA